MTDLTRTHVALLRGINVGGRNKMSMDDLREVFVSLGHTEVASYIQSGNVAFAAADPGAGTAGLAGAIKTAVADQLAVQPIVVVVSGEEMRQVVRDNPFREETDPKAVHAVFSSDVPDRSRVASVAEAVQRARAKGSPDDARVVGGTLYLWTPGGLGRSKLAAELARAGQTDGAATSAGTARNWATVLALAQLLSV